MTRIRHRHRLLLIATAALVPLAIMAGVADTPASPEELLAALAAGAGDFA